MKDELIKMIEQMENDKMLRKLFHIVKKIIKNSSCI